MPAALLQRGHTAAIKGSQTAGSRAHRCTAASLGKACGQHVQVIDSFNQVVRFFEVCLEFTRFQEYFRMFYFEIVYFVTEMSVDI